MDRNMPIRPGKLAKSGANPAVPFWLSPCNSFSGCQLSGRFRRIQENQKFLRTKPIFANPLYHINIPIFQTASFPSGICNPLHPSHLQITASPNIFSYRSEPLSPRSSGTWFRHPACRRDETDYALMQPKLLRNFHPINRLREKHTKMGPPFYFVKRTRFAPSPRTNDGRECFRLTMLYPGFKFVRAFQHQRFSFIVFIRAFSFRALKKKLQGQSCPRQVKHRTWGFK